MQVAGELVLGTSGVASEDELSNERTAIIRGPGHLGKENKF